MRGFGNIRIPLRPQNACASCEYTWYPKGHQRSIKCPHCNDLNVIVVAPPAEGKSSAPVVIGVLMGLFSLVVILTIASGRQRPSNTVVAGVIIILVVLAVIVVAVLSGDSPENGTRMRRKSRRARLRLSQAVSPHPYTYLSCGCGSLFRIKSNLEVPKVCPKCGGRLRQGFNDEATPRTESCCKRDAKPEPEKHPATYKAAPKSAPVVEKEFDYEDLYMQLTSVFWGFFYAIGVFAKFVFEKGRELAKRPSKPAHWRSISES